MANVRSPDYLRRSGAGWTTDAQGYEAEWQTRRRRINPRLEALGWKVTPYDLALPLTAYHLKAIEEFPTDHGPADYALCTEGRIVAVIEAKRLTLGPQNVLTQAERYARGATGNPFDFQD